MNVFRLRCAAAALGLLVASCGEDNDKGAASDAATAHGDASDAASASEGPGQSGVELSKTVGQLTDSDVQMLCMWNNQLSQELQPSSQQLCQLSALNASTQLECEAKLKLCTFTGSTPPSLNDCSKVSADGLSERCSSVSVEAYETCMVDTVQQRQQRFTQLSCAQAGTPLTQETPPDSCKRWIDTCPDLAP